VHAAGLFGTHTWSPAAAESRDDEGSESMSQWRPENETDLVGTATTASRPQRIVKVQAGPVSPVRPKSLTVTVDDGVPVEVGRAVGGAGKVILFKLNNSPAARQLEVALDAAHRTDRHSDGQLGERPRRVS